MDADIPDGDGKGKIRSSTGGRLSEQSRVQGRDVDQEEERSGRRVCCMRGKDQAKEFECVP